MRTRKRGAQRDSSSRAPKGRGVGLNQQNQKKAADKRAGIRGKGGILGEKPLAEKTKKRGSIKTSHMMPRKVNPNKIQSPRLTDCMTCI